MEYINIKLETLGDIRFVGARPVMRATWLSLLAYCAKQENSGRIANCRSWGNDTWAQIAGLRKAEVHTPCGLWEWDGDDVVVWGYPLHNQEVCQVRRRVGRGGGIASGASRRASKTEPIPEPNGEPFASPNGEANLEQKGKEKVKEDNSTTTTPAPVRAGGFCTLEQARNYAETYSKANAAGLNIPMHVVTQWHDDRESTGWVTVKGGVEIPIVDWQADLRKFATHYTRNDQAMPPARGGSTARLPVKLTTTHGWGPRVSKPSATPAP